MLTKDALMGACLALLVPLGASMIVLYSDVQSIKKTKADKVSVLQLKADVGKQMALNTQAIQNLDTTLGKLINHIEIIREDRYGEVKQEQRNRGQPR